MSHHSSTSKPARLLRQSASVALIAGMAFLTPYSITMSFNFSHADEATDTASTSSSSTSSSHNQDPVLSPASDPSNISTASDTQTTSDDSSDSDATTTQAAPDSDSSASKPSDETASTSSSSPATSSSSTPKLLADTNATSTVSSSSSDSELSNASAASSSGLDSATAAGTAGTPGGSNSSSSSSNLTAISSGDSTTSAEVDNTLNTNSASFGTTSTTTDASSTLPDATVENNSTTTASTTIGLDSKTGDNSASSTDDVAVLTGDAIANASLLNVVNTNLVNSFGELLALSNMLQNSTGQVDFRTLDFFSNALSSLCPVCGGTSLGNLSVLGNGTATLDDLLSAHASTGGNSAASASGTASLASGDAYAAANLINLINSNFVDSKYLFLTYNNFGSWDGNIVFPNADAFLAALSSSAASTTGAGNLSLSNTGTASVNDDVSADASSGGNSFTTLGSSTPGGISSGSSSAMTNILNLLNANAIGGASMNILFNVKGNWSGTIIGLPPGVQWTKTDNGFVLSYDTYEGLADEIAGASASSTDVSNAASTTLNDRISVGASSGGNAATGTTGSVSSGDAYAAANIINVANTNMIGRNMFWAIVNIFGDWSGDVSFGMPDLWIGGHADMTGSSVDPGEQVVYHLTVINNGDLPATGVTVSTDLGSQYLTDSAGKSIISTNLGTIAPKESKSFDITATASRSMPSSKDMITTDAKVASVEDDNNMADNDEQIAVVLGREHSSGGSSSKWRVKDDATTSAATSTVVATASPLTITESHAGPSTVGASSTVDYSVVVENNGDTPVYNASYHDRIMDGAGNVMHGEVWDLGEIGPHEQLNLSYSVFFNDQSPSGIYTNSGYVTATAGVSSTSTPIVSNVALDSITVIAAPRTPLSNVLSPAQATSGISVGGLSTSTASSSGVLSTDPSQGNDIPQDTSSKNLLASVFYARPTAMEMTIISIVLLLLAFGLSGLQSYRRRRYA